MPPLAARCQKRTASSTQPCAAAAVPAPKPWPNQETLRYSTGTPARSSARSLHSITAGGEIALCSPTTTTIKRDAGQRARRWVVERTHSWMNRFRRLLMRWEKRADTYIAMLHLACALIMWRAATRLPE